MNDSLEGSDDLRDIYRTRFANQGDYRDRVWKILTEHFFSQWIQPSAAVLDLGCGHGEFINNIRAFRKFGMDLNPDSVIKAASGVTVLQQDCSARWPLPSGALDVVFTSNFFEHLPTKQHLEITLRHAWSCLKPGGTLIAMGPNIKCVPGAYWDFFDHYLPLTELSLAEALRKAGFELNLCIARFLPYTMSNRTNYPLWALRLYLSMHIAWPIFGKQFLVVGSKPHS